MIGCTRYEHAFGSAALQPTASDFFCPNQDSKKICCQKRDAPLRVCHCGPHGAHQLFAHDFTCYLEWGEVTYIPILLAECENFVTRQAGSVCNRC